MAPGSQAAPGRHVDRLLPALVRRVLHQGHEPAGHEAARSNGSPASRHFRDLDDAARRRDLDAPAGAGGHDLEVLHALAGVDLPKFRPDGLLVVHAGGDAGMFSAIVGGWVSGQTGSVPVTRKVLA